MGEAEEFFWHISNETLLQANTYMIGLDALDRGVQIKAIEPVGYSPQTGIITSISDEAKKRFAVHRANSTLMNRRLEKFDVALYMSEKEVAVLAFPALTGEFDYLGFTSTDPMVLEWCMDLHNYYWEKGIKVFGN
jgi:predicted transcriptional regulator